jgi:ABC-type antimicrobial peptide transport system permease subunit
MKQLLIEASAVGAGTIIVGFLVGFFVGKMFSVDLPSICKKWNKNNVMEISLFFTGFFLHLLCEFTGLNKWYCKNGVACK